MKKYLLLVVLFSFVLFWCAPRELTEEKTNQITEIDITAITDLSVLQGVITQVSVAMNSWTLSLQQAEKLINQLQHKYLDLIDATNKNIEDSFATIEQRFIAQSFPLRSLPLRAKKVWLIEPQGMFLDTLASKHLSTTEYDSTILVYTWDYALALQQAERIAQSAHLQISENFKEAQSIAQGTSVDYISGLDIAGLRKWIVYINHELLDTSIEQLLSVSVDEVWTLTIEATKYKE